MKQWCSNREDIKFNIQNFSQILSDVWATINQTITNDS